MEKWLEEMVDFLLFLGILVGLLLFFLLYWKSSFQLKYAEFEVQNFLTEARVEGKITLEMYEELLRKVGRINEAYELEITYAEYKTSPVYDKMSSETLTGYYMKRNIRKKKNVYSDPWFTEENAGQMGTDDELYTGIIPEKIEASVGFFSRKGGTGLTGDELWITAFFSDGSSKIITPQEEKWQDTYDENYNGIQKVTISYYGVETSVQILTENGRCQNCRGSCEGRTYSDYAAFPYCTECMSMVPLFTGNLYEEEVVTDAKSLVSILDKDGEAVLNKGGYLCVSIRQKGRTRSVLQESILTDGGSQREK